MAFSPLTIKKLTRFKSIKRGYYSFILICALLFLSLFAEFFINSRAIIVKFNGRLYFPVYGNMIPGTTFGFDYDYETNYRDLAEKFKAEKNSNWILMPLVPFNPYENDLKQDSYPPFKPSLKDKHYFGTDKAGRDIIARLIYGFRIAFFFSFVLLAANYIIGIGIGCAMGFFGGRFDLFLQRIIEIWSNIPFLYVVIILSSIIIPNFFMLIIIIVFFEWIGMTWTMRTITYKEKAREYILAAKALGASNFRIIFKHIIPNSISVIITFVPFSISGGITALTSLDYLGFGLPPPTTSWGELLQQGWTNMEAYWIAGSVILAMTITLIAVTFIGEAIREAFDPKLYTTYE